MNKNWKYQVFGPFSEMIQNDTIFIINIVTSHYGFVLCYIILYIRTYNIQRIVSRKVLKNLNLREKTETFTKKDLLVMEVSYWNTRILEQIFLI